MDVRLQTDDSFRALIEQIECANFEFRYSVYNGVPSLQIVFEAADSDTGETELQYCRKWTLQYTMCDTEVIRTAYMAAEAAFKHELQESFTFRKARVYDPHMDLVAVAEWMNESNRQDTRQSVEDAA